MLVARKTSGEEKGRIEDADSDFHRREVERLAHELEQARDASTLPERPRGADALNDLLIRLRMRS